MDDVVRAKGWRQKKPPSHELTLSHELLAVVFGNLHHLWRGRECNLFARSIHEPEAGDQIKCLEMFRAIIVFWSSLVCIRSQIVPRSSKTINPNICIAPSSKLKVLGNRWGCVKSPIDLLPTMAFWHWWIVFLFLRSGRSDSFLFPFIWETLAEISGQEFKRLLAAQFAQFPVHYELRAIFEPRYSHEESHLSVGKLTSPPCWVVQPLPIRLQRLKTGNPTSTSDLSSTHM